MARRILVLAFVALACGHGDDNEGGTETETTSFGTTFASHDDSFSSTFSMTFTNSSSTTSDTFSTSDATLSSSDDGSSTTASADSTETSGTTAADSGSSDGGETGNPGGPCCTAQRDAGCGDAAIEQCVCAQEPFCCDTAWDDVCTVQVVVLGCAECPNIGGDGDCCAPHGNPGCDDEDVEVCVCTMDYVCCLEPWDEICADAAQNECDAMCM
jgi:hypothetical protein